MTITFVIIFVTKHSSSSSDSISKSVESDANLSNDQLQNEPNSNPNPNPNPSSSSSFSSLRFAVPALNGNGNVNRNDLTFEVLMGSLPPPSSFVDFSAMALPSNAADPLFTFSGTLILPNPQEIGFQVVDDWYNYGNNAERRRLPPIEADIVSSGSHLIPFIRYNQRTSHQYWEYILSAGRVWYELGDHGMMRAAIPFTLTQKNAQCAHNGVFMFLFNNENGGTISKIWYQITQETCLYFKANYWGLLDVIYRHNEFLDSSTDPTLVIDGYLSEIEGRIPIKPLSEISVDYPAVDWTQFASSADGMSTPDITMNGVYFNGIHYIGTYPTRSGQYPFPEQLIGPSYSTAKSTWLGIVGMYLQHRFGGFMDEVMDIGVGGRTANRWRDVTNNDCIDMATGNYRFASWMDDESNVAMENGFFLPETHSSKFSWSTTYFARRVPPGTYWVYHSSDHYLCGFSAKRFLRNRTNDPNADIHDALYDDVYGPLGCSDVLKETKRTYDVENEPFASHGLFYTRDDVVKLAKLMNSDDGIVDGQRVLDAQELRSAMQLTQDKGLSIGNADDTQNNAWYYNNGVWSGRKLWTLRQCPVDIPLMRGYGGIHVSMYPNGAIYYYFNDNDDKEWLAAANEINNLDPFC